MQTKLSVIDTIKEQFDDLFPAERRVADYILDHTEEAVSLNISDLAKNSGTSEATVVRFSKHLGYEGYYQMHLLLSRDFGKIESQEKQFEKHSSSEKFFATEAKRIVALGRSIEFHHLLEVAKILLECRCAHIVAAGNTIPVAMDLGFRLERSGVPATYSMLPEHMYNHVMLSDPADAVIAISRSGASKHVIRAMELARKRGNRTVTITGEKNNPLLASSDCILLLSEKSHETRYTGVPDSHLLEYALNDAILYAINGIQSVNQGKGEMTPEDVDDIGILLSEFKL